MTYDDQPAEDDDAVEAFLVGPPGSLHRMGEEPEALGPNDRGRTGDRERELEQAGAEIASRIPPPPEGLQRRPAQGAADYRPELPDPVYVAQEVHGEVPERPSPDAWAATQEQLREELAREPLTAVDPADDRMAEAIYVASLVEPYGMVPWERLGDRARTTYRRQARRVRELLGETTAASVEPQRVVVGFGDPMVAADVLSTLRRWKEEGFAFGEVEALIERIEGAGQ